NWTQKSPPTSPSPRSGAVMAYDQATGDIVLFGGYDHNGASLGDTWIWNGTTWTKVFPATSRPAGGDQMMTYDSATGNAILFGGNQLDDRTWSWNGVTWSQLSTGTNPHTRFFAGMDFD